ncbi:MAG: hypothetical protein ACLGJC_09370, partial [Alphaproteobacteria bacterium]
MTADTTTTNHKYKFGDRIEMIAASHDNPHKFGFFIRRIHRSGRMNPGAFFEVTDGNGEVWFTPPDNVRAAPASPSAAQPAATTVPGWRMVPIDPNVHMIGALSEYTDEPIEAWYAALAHVVHSQPDREA